MDAISAETIQTRMIGASQAVSFLPMIELKEAEIEDVRHGRAIRRDNDAELWRGAEWVRLIDSDNELVALASPEGGLLHSKKVLISG